MDEDLFNINIYSAITKLFHHPTNISFPPKERKKKKNWQFLLDIYFLVLKFITIDKEINPQRFLHTETHLDVTRIVHTSKIIKVSR